MKRIVILAVFTVVIFLAAFAMFSAIFQTTEHKIADVTTESVQETVYATGFVEPVKMREIRAQRPGTIATIFKDTLFEDPRTLKEGSIVKAGQPIIKFRDTSREAVKAAAKIEFERVAEQLKEGSAFLQSFESRIDEAVETASDLRAREERLKSQYNTGNISKDTYDASKTRAVVAEERVIRLREDLRQALADLKSNRASVQAKYEVAQAAEEDDTIRSPIDGRILSLPIKVGEFAKAGQLLLKVGDTREFHIEAEVDEEDIAKVRVDKSVLIRLAGIDSAVKGKVVEILPEANRLTKSFVVRVAFTKAITPEPEKLDSRQILPGQVWLYSGMTAELGIVIREEPQAITIPRPALVRGNWVFVFENGTVSKKKVQIGVMNFSKVQITEGLGHGQRVVVSGLSKLENGDRIQESKGGGK